MLIDTIHERAARNKKKILLPEGDDPRVREAASEIQRKSVADITLISRDSLDGIKTLSPSGDSLQYGMDLLAAGEYDGLVAGAVYTTSRVIRSAIRKRDLRSGGLVSSFFLIETQNADLGEAGSFLFADCAVVPDPDEKQLAAIAVSTAESARRVLGWEPRVALLSFSTKGSAAHRRAQKVGDAVKELKRLKPGFLFDGELQLDAAVVPEVALSKDPEGVLGGRANILIFPDLDSGNIGYKLAERLAGARAVGPILQGFSRPVNDLSRGCSSNDIVNVAAFTVLQAS